MKVFIVKTREYNHSSMRHDCNVTSIIKDKHNFVFLTNKLYKENDFIRFYLIRSIFLPFIIYCTFDYSL